MRRRNTLREGAERKQSRAQSQKGKGEIKEKNKDKRGGRGTQREHTTRETNQRRREATGAQT